MNDVHTELNDAVRDRAIQHVFESDESEDARAYEAHLEICATCSREVAGLKSVMNGIALSVPPVDPPPTLKQRLLGAIQKAPYSLTRVVDRVWRESGIDGVTYVQLSLDPAANRHTILVRLMAGAAYPMHAHDQPEECYVVDGDLIDQSIRMKQGDFIRFEDGTRHGPITTERGCLLLITASLDNEVLTG